MKRIIEKGQTIYNEVPIIWDESITQGKVIEDEDFIRFVVSSCANGPRQERFLRGAFSLEGANPASYTGFSWTYSWRVALDDLIERLILFIEENPIFGLIIYFRPGPMGGWWSGRYYIRQIPVNTPQFTEDEKEEVNALV